MKKSPHLWLLVLTILVVGYFIITQLLRSIDWTLIEQKESPSKNYTLYLYHYNSDSDRHAPYGIYVYIKPKYSFKSPIHSNLIFAGYCSNSDVIQWRDERLIEINCKSLENEPIKTLSKKIYGIIVKLSLST